MSGVEFLEQAIALAPEAKRVLLTAYADTQAAIDAINRVSLDHYLLKPWDPPEEQLYPVVDDLLDAWRADAPAAVRPDPGGRPPLVARVARRTRLPGPKPGAVPLARRRARRRGAAAGRGGRRRRPTLPLVLFPDGGVAARPERSPSWPSGPACVRRAELPFYDLRDRRRRPGRASRRRCTAPRRACRQRLIEREAPGGQAGQSSRIENYLGFPVGLSGSDLARRATAQAQRFGAELLTVQEVTGIDERGPAKIVQLAGGDELGAAAVIVSTGVDYRRLEAPGIEELTGRGVYYGGSRSEGVSCRDEHVVVVGGANSAGQAAIYFAGYAQQVTHALPRRQPGQEHVALPDRHDRGDCRTSRCALHGEVAEAHGGDSLERITVREHASPASSTRSPLAAMFVFIGARPQTDWLPDAVARDPRGFVLAGAGAAARGRAAALAAGARPLPARDQHARRVRRRRRAQPVDEAGGLGRRRGLDGGAASSTSTWRCRDDRAAARARPVRGRRRRRCWRVRGQGARRSSSRWASRC